MTIETFLKLTATSPAPALRRAIAVALAVDRPSAGEGYTRFYRRVIAELGSATGNDAQATGHAVLAGVLEQEALASVPEGSRIENQAS
jgi:hypothetical protein